jgi:hypothetical protein
LLVELLTAMQRRSKQTGDGLIEQAGMHKSPSHEISIASLPPWQRRHDGLYYQ